MPKVPYTKTGKAIQGTYERMYGTCPVSVPDDSDPSDHTTWDFDGCKIFYDGMETVVEDGQVVFIDEDGDEVLESEIEWRLE